MLYGGKVFGGLFHFVEKWMASTCYETTTATTQKAHTDTLHLLESNSKHWICTGRKVTMSTLPLIPIEQTDRFKMTRNHLFSQPDWDALHLIVYCCFAPSQFRRIFKPLPLHPARKLFYEMCCTTHMLPKLMLLVCVWLVPLLLYQLIRSKSTIKLWPTSIHIVIVESICVHNHTTIYTSLRTLSTKGMTLNLTHTHTKKTVLDCKQTQYTPVPLQTDTWCK